MKKSEQYHYAMLCVLESEFNSDIKLEVLETLMDRKQTEMLLEKHEAEKEEQDV